MAAPLATPAHAQSLDVALDRLAADTFAETATAVAEIATSGSDRAALILEAMADRRLLVDAATKAVIIKTVGGDHIDARTGAKVAAPAAELVAVRTNNRVRGAIEAAIGGLTLMSPDAAKRLSAAEAVFKSRDAKALPALDLALTRETDANVRRALSRARAAVILTNPGTAKADFAAVIDVLVAGGDAESVGLIRTLLSSTTDADTRRLLEAGLAKGEQRQRATALAQNIWFGLSLGSVLLLAAIGLAITFGVMGVINMAHGEMVMLGAYTTFVVQEIFRAYAPGAFDWSLAVALPLAFLVTALVGIAIERGIISFLYGRPLETLLATWGVSLMLQQAVRTTFGPTNREVGSPSYMSGTFELMGLQIAWGRMWIILFTLIVFATLLVVLKATPLGLQMRAVTQNRRMAAAMGIRTGRIDALTFALGSGIAGIAGVALSQIDNVSPNLGQSYIIDSFMVVVFGGVGNLWGTLVSAFALGIANKFLEPFAGAVLAKILILVLLILFIQKRPRGLFALKGRAIEA
ncbi:MAG: urea ABC transporter permease subunit UrtB [Hyphomicrobiaceae bacterium]